MRAWESPSGVFVFSIPSSHSQDKSRDDFPTMDAFRSYLRENISQCEDWFWKAFRGGVFWGGNNLIHYYENIMKTEMRT